MSFRINVSCWKDFRCRLGRGCLGERRPCTRRRTCNGTHNELESFCTKPGKAMLHRLVEEADIAVTRERWRRAHDELNKSLTAETHLLVRCRDRCSSASLA